EMALISIDVGPDPDQYWLWHSGTGIGTLNFAYARGWGIIDKDLEDGRAVVDPPSRLAVYIDFQMVMAEVAPALFLYSAHYIVEAAIGAMQNGYTHYTPASGIYEAREAVAGFVGRTLKAQVDPSEVVLVPGSKNVLLFTLLACVEPGDEVIVPDPGYPAYA